MKKYIHIDLTTGSISDCSIDPELARDFIGGSGLAARLLYEMLDLNVDPLGPENPLMFMTGPLVGTSMPAAGRCTVSARSPLTGYWGESNTGGFIGSELRFAGYDGILITGRSETPCWISILDNEIAIHDAQDLWGKDTYQTQDLIRSNLSDPKIRIACIGPAGENLVKMAAIINDHGRAAGRTGMGAVMGSKNLKAIAIRGTGKIHLVDSDSFNDAVADIHTFLKEDLAVEALRLAGTASYVDMGLMFGDVPIRYYQQGEWEEGSNLSGVLLTENHLTRNTTCYHCPIVCGRETRTVKYKVDKVDGPEYETIASLGSLTMVDDLEGVIYAGHLCNTYGLDTISTGSTIALAIDLFDKGILRKKHTGGMILQFGDVKMIHHLIKLIGRREGFGDQLADGSAVLGSRYGVPDKVATVRNLEIPMHDSRSFSGMAPIYALSPRGACHLQGDMFSVDTGQSPQTELDIHPGDRFDSSEAKGKTAARAQAWRSVYNALIVCHFMNAGADKVVSALNASTGWDYSLDGIMETGKRIFTLKRLLNAKLGSTVKDDRLPDFMLKPFEEGGTLGFSPDLEPLLVGAYKEHGWDPDTGMPSEKTLQELKLDFVYKDK